MLLARLVHRFAEGLLAYVRPQFQIALRPDTRSAAGLAWPSSPLEHQSSPQGLAIRFVEVCAISDAGVSHKIDLVLHMVKNHHPM